MKNVIKYLLVMVLIVPCIFLFGACTLFEKEIVNSIVSVEKTDTEGLVDTYTITYTDGTTSTFTVTNGADGQDGRNGLNGPRGISIVSIQKTGTQGLIDTYTITFSDSTTTTFTITNGADGEAGEDGQNGTDGANGRDGADGVSIVSINKTGTQGLIDTYTITFSNNSTTTFTITNGADGAAGADGEDGTDGQDLTVESIYATAVDNGFEGTLLEFIEQYLSSNTNNLSQSINKALMSAVCIFSDANAGSGVIYQLDKTTGNALIITNYHVAYNTNTNNPHTGIRFYIYGEDPFDQGDYISATVLGGSRTYDIAVLKVTNSSILRNSDAMAIEIANSDEIIIGEAALAIGNSEGCGMSATCGIVSVDSEYIEIDEMGEYRVMRMDAAVNSGNSGGGLFNNAGKLIGIVNAKVKEEGVEGMCFAIPSNNAISVVENIIENCNGTPPNTKIKVFGLGVSIDGKNTRAVYDSENMVARIYEDVVVDTVTSSSKFSLQVGDIIKSIQINSGEIITLNRDFTLLDAILKVRVNDTVKLTIERAGSTLNLSYQAKSGDFVIVD